MKAIIQTRDVTFIAGEDEQLFIDESKTENRSKGMWEADESAMIRAKPKKVKVAVKTAKVKQIVPPVPQVVRKIAEPDVQNTHKVNDNTTGMSVMEPAVKRRVGRPKGSRNKVKDPKTKMAKTLEKGEVVGIMPKIGETRVATTLNENVTIGIKPENLDEISQVIKPIVKPIHTEQVLPGGERTTIGTTTENVSMREAANAASETVQNVITSETFAEEMKGRHAKEWKDACD